MSSVAGELPSEITSPSDYGPLPDDAVSYTLRGESTTTATDEDVCDGCRRVTDDPHKRCVKHLIRAGLPVCGRKSRCLYCADTSNRFWIRYMKSYYNQCENLSEDHYQRHLAIQTAHGIPLYHRKRRSGSAVYMLRDDGQVMTPEKLAPASVRSSSPASVITGRVFGAAEPAPAECAPPAILRPIDTHGQLGAAIRPEDLLSEEEQEAVRRIRAAKQKMTSPPSRASRDREKRAAVRRPSTERRRVMSPPPRRVLPSPPRETACSPEHTLESCEQIVIDAQSKPDKPDVASVYSPDTVKAFWERHEAERIQDSELYLVNQPADRTADIAGLTDIEDTSDDDYTSGEEEPVPLSPYTMKRPCQLRAELELQKKYSKVPIDVDGIYQRCTTACGATVYNRPGFLQFRERLHDTLLGAVNEKGVLPLKGLTERLLSVVLTPKERAAWGDGPGYIPPQDVGTGDKPTSTATRDTSKAGGSSQRDRSPVKGSIASAGATRSAGAGGDGHGDDDSDEGDDDKRKKKRKHPGDRDAPGDASSRDDPSREPRRRQDDDDDEDTDVDIEFIESGDEESAAEGEPYEDLSDESEDAATHYDQQHQVYRREDHQRAKKAFYGRYDRFVNTSKGLGVRRAVQSTVPVPEELQEVRSSGEEDQRARVCGRPLTEEQKQHQDAQSERSMQSRASRRSAQSRKSHPADPLQKDTSNPTIGDLNHRQLYEGRANPIDDCVKRYKKCGATCAEAVRSYDPTHYKLQQTLKALQPYCDGLVRPATTPYGIGEAGAQKLTRESYDTLVFDATLRKLIDKGWRHARERQPNWKGYGNLPVIAELHVPWAPYIRPKKEPSLPERGFHVPLDKELPRSAAAWHQDGKFIAGSFINRASMFDLHRLHMKRVCVTSCTGQIFKGVREICKKLQGLLLKKGELRVRIKDPERAENLKTWLEHQETLLMGLDSVFTDGQKLDVALHIMTTVIFRDGVLNNTECEPRFAE